MNNIFMKVITQRTKDIIDKFIINPILNRKDTTEIEQGFCEYVNDIYSKQVSQNYQKSYENLKIVTKTLKSFPTIEQWNNYAKVEECLNHISLQYITRLDWHKLKRKVEKECE